MKKRLLLFLLNTGIALVSITIGAFGIEYVLGYRTFNGYCVWPPRMAHTFSPEPGVLPGVYGESRFSTNKYGIRGRNPSWRDDYRILVIGGSTTECLYLDDREAWPRVFETGLNKKQKSARVWIGNIGKSGLNTGHHIVQVRIMLDQFPEIDAIVLLVGINDMSMKLSRGNTWQPGLQTAIYYEGLRKMAFMIEPRQDVQNTRFPHTKHRLCMLLGCGHCDLDDRPSVPHHFTQGTKGEGYKQWRMNRGNSKKRLDKPVRIGSGLREYKKNLNEIIDIAQKHAVRIVFATQPCLWKKEMPAHEEALLWMGGVGQFQKQPGQPYYTPGSLEKIMAKYNDVLVSLCVERDVQYVDLAGLCARDTTVFYDDCHFNESGARFVGEVFSDYFSSNGPLAK